MIKHISEVADSVGEYLDNRRKGLISSWRTGFPKLDSSGIDGIEWGSTVTIGGRPGVGKSIFSDLLIDRAMQSNPLDYDILDYNWEMSERVQLIRKLATRTGKTYKELCSADGLCLSDEDMEVILQQLELYKTWPIYFESEPKTPLEFAESVKAFKRKTKKKLLVRVDHTLLAKMSASDHDRVTMLMNLLNYSNSIKKEGDVIFIFLTQLNREIEERQENNKSSAFPRMQDVFGGDATSMFSETMILLNRPSNYNITYYGGRPQGVSVDQTDLFAHVVKNRNAEPDLVIRFKTNFAKMIMEEDI